MKVITKKTTPSKKGNDTYLYLGAALLLGGAAYVMSGNNTDVSATETETPNATPNTPAPKPPNYDLVLKIGSKGQEVVRLQQLMGITADGIFGAKTEARLYEIKRVKSISINGYPKIPNSPPLTKVVFAPGTKVMVKNKNGVKVYLAERKADGTYFSTGKVSTTYGYGEAIGTIRAKSADGQSHSVNFKSFWDGSFFLHDAVGFVNTIDIEKY